MASIPFEDSKAWKLARILRKEIRIAVLGAECFRQFEFDRQMYRAALSVMNNVAEGWETPTPREKGRFFSFALRSCGEVRSLLYAGMDDGIFSKGTFDALMDRCMNTMRTVAGLHRSAKNRAG